eukprot:m.54192 g.54192  ORF g.54192 m.54192 type:complete len:76 (-) comp10910_c0_seq1:3-230(-)
MDQLLANIMKMQMEGGEVPEEKPRPPAVLDSFDIAGVSKKIQEAKNIIVMTGKFPNFLLNLGLLNRPLQRGWHLC